MKRINKEWLIRLVLLFIGLTIAHLGVTMFLVSELGSDTFTIFVQGLAGVIGITVGQMHVLTLCVLMAVMLIFAREYIKAGTVVCAVCGGWIIDFFIWLFHGIVSSESTMAVRIIVMVLGCVILGIGMSLVIKSDAGTGPNDLIAIILTDRLKKIQFRWVRMSCDAFFVILGFLFGGVLGIGTLVAVVLTGPVVQWCMPKSEKLVNNVIGKVVHK